MLLITYKSYKALRVGEFKRFCIYNFVFLHKNF
jgi:hypothetical protein